MRIGKHVCFDVIDPHGLPLVLILRPMLNAADEKAAADSWSLEELSIGTGNPGQIPAQAGV